MYDNAYNGNFNKVPVLMGINSEEGIGLGRGIVIFVIFRYKLNNTVNGEHVYIF